MLRPVLLFALYMLFFGLYQRQDMGCNGGCAVTSATSTARCQHTVFKVFQIASSLKKLGKHDAMPTCCARMGLAEKIQIKAKPMIEK